MIKQRIAKIAGIAAGATLVFGSFVPMVGAVTIAELQAQINALMAQLSTLQGGSTVSTGTTFTQNLTVGSTGAEVVALQTMLVAQGHLVMPAGVAMGYFGSLTQAAVAKWQAANGVSPTAGYWGPISRAKANMTSGGTTTVPDTTVPGSTVGITTPGVEGTITASLSATPAAVKLYEGQTMIGVLGIKLEAKASDIRIERIKLDLDHVTGTTVADTNFYRKIASKVYVMDGSTVLGSMDLNISTIVKDGANYFITVSGLSFVVPKGGTKVLTVALDAIGTWDADFNAETFSVTVPVDGVRGVDGAGVNQYSPATAFTRNFTSEDALVDASTMTVSTNASTPLANQVIAEQGSSNNEYDRLEVLKADFKAEKDAVTITDLVIDIVRGGTAGASSATATTAYLYDGDTVVGSAAVAGTSLTAMGATFADIDYVVPKDTTKTLSIQLDIDDAALAHDTFAVDIDTADVTAENSAGAGITESGTAVGKTMTVRKVGPQLTLVSKSVTTSGVPQGSPAVGLTSTSTLSATFNLKIKALGGTLTFGNVASGTPLISSSTASFAIYRNGSFDSSIGSYATSTSYTIPSTCVAEAAAKNGCTLAEGAEVTVPVTFQILGRQGPGKANDAAIGTGLTAGSVYSVGFEGINWFNDTTGAVQRTDFMATTTEWRTADVSFP